MPQPKFNISIDGDFVPPKEYSGADTTRVTIQQDNGETTVTYANTLSFHGAARDYILNKLVYGNNPQTDFVSIKIYDTCCKDADGNAFLAFDGKTTRADIDFCDPKYNSQCSVECSILDASLAGERVQCVRNMLIAQKRNGAIRTLGENEFRRAPEFGYYDEARPKSFTYTMLYVSLFVLTLYLPLVAILFIFSFGTADLSFLYRGLLDVFLSKGYHKAPFLHSYFTNVCRLCGLTLRSSLFEPTKPYHNLTRLDTPFSEGASTRAFITGTGTFVSVDAAYNDFNRPNITLPQLMQSLTELNLEYQVTDRELLIERKDFFGNNVWIDFSTRESDILELCFNSGDEAQPAGEIFKFADDGTDKIGNEANPTWSGEIVDYNTPTLPVLRGIKQTIVQYGTARFIGDGLESAIEKVSRSGYFNFVTFGTSPVADGTMLMSTGTASLPKLIMYDGSSPINDALAEELNDQINIRAWLRADSVAEYGVAGFYENLLKINDPRLNLQRNLQYTLRFTYICDDIRTRTFGQVVSIPINGVNTIAKVNTIEIDFANREITISGVL
jgi:hypothetical protein